MTITAQSQVVKNNSLTRSLIDNTNHRLRFTSKVYPFLDYNISDIIKQSIGHEKEVFLKRRAKELNLVFKDEDQMRAEGI